MVAVPRWVVALPADGAAAAGGPSSGRAPSSTPFQLGGRFGYVRPDGAVTYVGTTLYQVALSTSGFINFTRLGTDWILQDSAGRPVSGFSGSGYPLLSPDGSRLFMVKTDLSGLRECDRGGETLWDRDFPTLVTCLSVQGDRVLVGLLDGSLHALNRQGSPVFDYAPAGSRVPVMVGCAVSPDGSHAAAVSGIDPQYLTVLARRDTGFTPDWKTPLPDQFRREVRVNFSGDARLLLVEGLGRAGLVDVGHRGLRWIAVQGALAGAAFPDGGRGVALLSRDGATARLVIEPSSGAAVCREQFPARDVFVGSIDGQLLLGLDGRLLRIDLEAL